MNEFDIIEQLFLNTIGAFSVPFHGAPLIMWFVGVAILMNFMRYLKIFITGSTIDEQSLRDFYNYMENLDRQSYDKDMYSMYVPDDAITINGLNKLDNVIGINGNDISLIGISDNIRTDEGRQANVDGTNGNNIQEEEEK